ncbi:hypothetical protein [Sulfuricurvum sp.]|uniref:hypothetical protein n=1 Tax=Sulfuricurvum sp. TaxID=2025608 RepID=UPI003C67EB4D
MKTSVHLALIAGVLCTSLSASTFDIAVSGSERGIDGFALSIGNYYRVPSREIMVIERSIPRDELTVVYLLSNRSHRSAAYITDLRLRGLSWWDITIHLGLDPYNLYVVDSYRHSGPPYGRAYGYHDGGKKHRLRDDEIVELSNVRFLSKYHGVSPDDVIDRRRQGEHYNIIDDHYRTQKVTPQHREENRLQQREENRAQQRVEQIKSQQREENRVQQREENRAQQRVEQIKSQQREENRLQQREENRAQQRVEQIKSQQREENRVQQREENRVQQRVEQIKSQQREQRKEEERRDERGSKGGKDERGNANKNQGNPNER